HTIERPEGVEVYNTAPQNHHLEKSIDFEIIELAHTALFRKEKTTLDLEIHNTDRAVGAILSNEISKIYGEQGLPDNTLKVNFKGSAGQSFGAFATKGLTLKIDGNANDYIGKGLSGAKLIVKVPEESTFEAHKNIIIGNVALYGATTGEAYFNGIAGERFCVRNSGAHAVVEGIGDHGCEYMTGGVAVILGSTGRNFGAGMSGGIAYIYDDANTFRKNCNTKDLNLDPVSEAEDKEQLHTLITHHYNYTQSRLAQNILEKWEDHLPKFIKVLPEEYRKALIRLEEEEKLTDLTE
ncbi:MAG: glutamate synthase subunit alpha, partial [Leeuwenhoekiella sp.]